MSGSATDEDHVQLVAALADTQHTKLAEHQEKDHWRGEPLAWLLDRAGEELGELREAVINGDSPADVWREAADVANFVAMAADVYARRAGK